MRSSSRSASCGSHSCSVLFDILYTLTFVHLTASQGWHSDQSYRRPPPDISLLHCKHPAAPGQGHTLFADCTAAYDALPAELKAEVAGRSILHSNTGMGRTERAVRAGRGGQPTRPDVNAGTTDPASLGAVHSCLAHHLKMWGHRLLAPHDSLLPPAAAPRLASRQICRWPWVAAEGESTLWMSGVLPGVAAFCCLTAAPVAHPIVRTHPVTRRKSLFLVMGQADWLEVRADTISHKTCEVCADLAALDNKF